jgi:hypothetical protein
MPPDQSNTTHDVTDNARDALEADRRTFLCDAGRFAVSVPPSMILLLSATMSSSAIAQSAGGKTHGNNGVGNGEDPQPPGNPPINDGPGTSPGNPGNKGGAHK